MRNVLYFPELDESFHPYKTDIKRMIVALFIYDKFCNNQNDLVYINYNVFK